MFISAQLVFPPQLFSPKLNPGLPWKDNKTYGVVIQISNLVIAVEPWYTIPTIRDTRLPCPPSWTMDTEAWEQSWRRATLLENEATSQGTVVHMPSSQCCGTLLLFICLFGTHVFIVTKGFRPCFSPADRIIRRSFGNRCKQACKACRRQTSWPKVLRFYRLLSTVHCVTWNRFLRFLALYWYANVCFVLSQGAGCSRRDTERCKFRSTLVAPRGDSIRFHVSSKRFVPSVLYISVVDILRLPANC